MDDEDFDKFAQHHHRDIYHLFREVPEDYVIDPEVDRFFMLDHTTRIATRLIPPLDLTDDD